MKQPSHALQEQSGLSRKGRDSSKEGSHSHQVSPLAGETDLARAKSGEGAKRSFAKYLRTNMTDVEKKLWQVLRAKRFEDFKFKRQVPIGPYIVDFMCFENRLIIELDGSQHEGSAHDVKRDAWLKAQDFRVLRFWNNDINAALDGTLKAIHDALQFPSHASQERSGLSRKGRDLEK